MKIEEVVGHLGPKKIHTTYENRRFRCFWAFPINGYVAGWKVSAKFLVALIHRMFGNLSSE